MEDKIRKIKSKEKFKHYYHSREKLINLKKQKTTFEERINTLEKYIKKNKKQNNINNLKISTLEEELSNKPKLPKNNFKKLIKETIKHENGITDGQKIQKSFDAKDLIIKYAGLEDYVAAEKPASVIKKQLASLEKKIFN